MHNSRYVLLCYSDHTGRRRHISTIFGDGLSLNDGTHSLKQQRYRYQLEVI